LYNFRLQSGVSGSLSSRIGLSCSCSRVVSLEETRMSPRFSSFLGRLLLAIVAASVGLAAQQADQGTATQSNNAAAQTAPAPPANPAPNTGSYDETQPSKVDIFTGYSWLSPNGAVNGNKAIPAGFTVAGSYWFNKYFGGGVETGNHFGNINTI